MSNKQGIKKDNLQRSQATSVSSNLKTNELLPNINKQPQSKVQKRAIDTNKQNKNTVPWDTKMIMHHWPTILQAFDVSSKESEAAKKEAKFDDYLQNNKVLINRPCN